MSLDFKRIVIAALSLMFLGSLLFVQWMEVSRRRAESGEAGAHIAIPDGSRQCVDCHLQNTMGLVEHWKDSTHAESGVGCVECHQAEKGDADGFEHYGAHIAVIVTPNDCARCHPAEAQEFMASHHAKGGNILASLDNFLAEVVEGSRSPFDPHAPTPGLAPGQGMVGGKVNGMASAISGCQQCHGGKVAFVSTDGGHVDVDDLKPGADGKPTSQEALARIQRDPTGKPLLHPATWPNSGIGRLNLDGSRGSCSACHSRHDFSPRRARQPENCGKCHLGPDHPQKEVYEESKHGVAYRDLIDDMNLDSDEWVLGEDYSAAPTCATCHMSANTRNGMQITHDPGTRISWTNRPPISLVLDTDVHGEVVKATDPAERAKLIEDTAQAKRNRMRQVCSHCHNDSYVNAFYAQYDEFVVNYNEKFARPGQALMKLLLDQQLLTPAQFDEEIEWSWYYLWHHEGRRARHGASMMAPDYAHWHGMFEVAERFYMAVIPQARELAEHAIANGKEAQGKAVMAFIDELLARPEHRWFEQQKKH
jgi:hydroxylamine dehydrogenase